MSIQIYNDGLAGAGAGSGASEVSRAQDVSRSTPGSQKPASGGSGEDSVEISSVSSTLSAQSSDRAARVAQLAAAYQGGNYQVNSMDVSKALVNNALQSGKVDSE